MKYWCNETSLKTLYMQDNIFVNITSKRIKRSRSLTQDPMNPFLCLPITSSLQVTPTIHHKQLYIKCSFTYDKQEPLSIPLRLQKKIFNKAPRGETPY